MSITRSKTFVELVAQRTPANARNDLDVYSRSEVDAEVAGVDLSAIESDIASISGSVVTLSGDLSDLSSEVVSISGALSTDIENLDISLTQSIVDYVVVDGSSPSVTGSFYAWGKIEGVVSGAPYWIQLYK